MKYRVNIMATKELSQEEYDLINQYDFLYIDIEQRINEEVEE